MATPPAVPMATLTPLPATTGRSDVASSVSGDPSTLHGSGNVRMSGVPVSPASSAQSSGESDLPPPGVMTRGQLRAKFEDFDVRDIFQEHIKQNLGDKAKNFVVQFGADKAMIARNLSDDEFRLLMESRDLFGPDLPVRWINFWDLSSQRNAIRTISDKYGFSRRLFLSIWAWDYVKQRLQQLESERKPPQVTVRSHFHRSGNTHTSLENPGATASGMAGITNPATSAKLDTTPDLERGPDDDGPEPMSPVGPPQDTSYLEGVYERENLATFRMMQSTIDYTSIDQEKRFVCIGANWLHKPPKTKACKNPSLVPPKHWSWFALCDDHTVLSFHEAPYYSKIPKGENEGEMKDEERKNMRGNTIKVLRQLSKCGLEDDKLKIMQLTSIREPMLNRRVGRTIAPEHHGCEGSSNLFYYLFEDYSAAFGILEHSNDALKSIRYRILKTADWKNKDDTSDIIPTLYKLDKELRKLHHLFANYKIMMERLLQSDVEGSDSVISDPSASEASMGSGHDHGKDWLSYRASNRFRRLQVQLQSLMLDTIKDYMDEKESLQNTYFNLTNQKDSQATERLTRSATLLAKLSVFFLPISFMTSYFSVQIPELVNSYTKWSYWGAFAVIASLSFLSLFFFSKVLMFLSERLDHWTERLERSVMHKFGLGEKGAGKNDFEEDD